MLKRRSFLAKAIVASILLLVSALPYGIARLLYPDNSKRNPKRNNKIDHIKLRPPGALKDEVAFNAACIGCGLCAEVCPPGCIQFYDQGGGDKANTPYIAPAEKACTLCNKCMPVCPTNALTETERSEVDMGIADIDETACYPWVDRGICGACAVICPLGEKAIGFEFANIYRPIVKDACVGCGLCVEVCPHPSLPIRIVEREQLT